MKINNNSNMLVQNEFLQKSTENVASGQNINSDKAAVLARNADAFKNVANLCYSKSEVYSGTSHYDVSKDQAAIDGYNAKANMAECINMLKSSVTPEDYEQLEQLGLIPDEDNPEAFVTVYERIQIELAAYCEDYNMTGLNINQDKLKTVLGSQSMANAVSKAESIASEVAVLDDNTKKYVLDNNLEPTLENIYKAIHSGATGNATGDPVSREQWQQLRGQVESFFKTNGITNTEENLANAKWMISENVPLTVENFSKLSAMNNVDFSDESYIESLNRNIAYTIYLGGDPMMTDVTGETYNMEKIHEAVSTVQSAMDQDVDYILKNNKKLNIENLKIRIEERKKEQAEAGVTENELYARKHKVLAEARAILTSGALFMMQKAGISITYTEITVLVDMTKAQNNTYAEQLFMLDEYAADEEEKGLLVKTMEVMAGFPSLPVGVAAGIYQGSVEYTAEAVYEEGNLIASRYRMAMETYEAVGTEVRRDLGDNISKAFRNIDELLIESGIEINDKNRRSARVLGYNAMEITIESVEAIGDITDELDALTKNLTPRAAVYLIRNGINPLNTDIRQLNESLMKINEQIGASEEERYSEYLWKLEKNKDISKEERDAYIQLYRIINHVNKRDGSVLGAVSKAGQEMTLANLYTAVRTRQTGSVDKVIDDETGLFDGTYSEDALTAYMEKTVDIMEDDTLHKEYMYEKMQQKLNDISQIQTMTESEFMRFVSGMEGISVNSIYSALTVGDRSFYKKLMGLDNNDNAIKKATDRISDTWIDSDNSEPDNSINPEDVIEEAYDELNEAVTSSNIVNTAETYENAVFRINMNKAAAFMRGQAKNRSYYVPMEIHGETTMVHMTIKEGALAEKGRITVYADTEAGKLSVLMYKQSGDLDKYEILAAADNEELSKRLSELCEGNVIVSDSVTDGMWSETATEVNEENVSYGELVRQAKSFIHNVLKKI